LIALVGFSVIIIGIVMIITPGPAILVIPAGLAILSLEFLWARRALKKLKAYLRIARQKTRRRAAQKASQKASRKASQKAGRRAAPTDPWP
ncbi:MAG: hypothetical protein RLZZ142_1689, partial [Verrucomicrobiota bacterium]